MSAGDHRKPSLHRRRAGLTRHSRQALVTVFVVIVAAVLLGLVVTEAAVGQQTSAANESSPPELHSGEKLNTTAVELVFVDEEGINISSISASDFLLSEGELSHVTATATGTNATATLVLSEPIPSDELTVGIASDSDIRDTSGTPVQTDGESHTVTISDMDGVPPRVLSANVGDAIGGPAEIQFSFDEELSAIDVEITGPQNTTLDIDDFDNPSANRYVTGYEPPESGEYTVELRSVTDTVGNTGNVSVARTIEANRSAPDAVIGIDFGASSGLNVTFDGIQSAGDRLSYTWDFGDGTIEDGERVAHEFTPEPHTVTLIVTDEFGNTDRDRLDLNLTDGLAAGEAIDAENQTTDPAVIINRDGGVQPESSLVSVTGAVGTERTEIGTADDSERPLLIRDGVTLDRVAVTTTVNSSFSLALAAVGPESVVDSSDENTTPVAGFTVLSDLAAADVSSGEFTFSIDADRLEALDLSPADIELHRETGGEWEPLETTVDSETDDQYQFTTTTPGFSRFAIVGVTGDGDSGDGDGTNGEERSGDVSDGDVTFQVIDATIEPTKIESGDTIDVTATVENQGESDGTFRAGLELDGDVAQLEAIEIAAGGSKQVPFTQQLDDTGTVSVTVNGTVAGEVTVEESDDESDDDELDVDEDAFTVTEVRLNETSIDPGEAVYIEGDVFNEGDEMKDYIAELEVDGEVVDTYEVPQVPPENDVPAIFEHRFDEEGTYTISVSGTESESEVAVGQGGLFSFLTFLPLGFVPVGLIQTIVMFVGVPLLFVYLALKSVAFYLGY